MTMGNEKLIIWDLDGTLVNSLPATYEAFNDGFEPYLGRRLSPLEIMSHFGASEEKIIAKLVGESSAEEACTRFRQSLARRMTEVVIYPEIVETLAHLGDLGYPLAIFTGRGRHGTEAILDHSGLRSHFRKIVTNTEVAKPKPDPEGIVVICEALGISATNSVMIGDSAMDIIAGHAVGAKTIGCVWDANTNRQALVEANAHHVFERPRHVVEWLEAR